MACYDWLTDDQLKLKVEELASRAHDANASSYAIQSQDWAIAHNELVLRKMIREQVTWKR